MTQKLPSHDLPYRWSDLVAAAASDDPVQRHSAVATAGARLETALRRAGFRSTDADSLMPMARAAASQHKWNLSNLEWAIRLRNRVVHRPDLGMPPAWECIRALDALRQAAMDLGTGVDVDESLAVQTSSEEADKNFTDHLMGLEMATRLELVSWMTSLPPNRRVEFVSFRDRIASTDVLRTIMAQRGRTAEETTEKRFAFLHALYGQSQSLGETLAQGVMGIENDHTRALQTSITKLGEAFEAQGNAFEARSEELRRKYGDNNDPRVAILKFVVVCAIILGALIYTCFH